jgi:mannose-6-phosphate isomerase-like protein (cupin superfamily)
MKLERSSSSMVLWWRSVRVSPAELIRAALRVRIARMRDVLTARSGRLGYPGSKFGSIRIMTAPILRTWAADDRREVIKRPADSKIAVLVPGVELCPLAGGFSGARNLFTALLTLRSKASYPLYSRPFTEVLVLLDGDASVEVEDRRYRLKKYDAMTISPRVPRKVVNLSSKWPAVLHVALACATPDQTWVNGRFTAVDQPVGATGVTGVERICRNEPSTRFELAPFAHFQDLFNADMGAQGICGGYGLFDAGARLPCHRHEYDESITIVQGTATCIVEGQRHELSGNATALVPQGRCHYFINLTLEPMAMIWVYAGDRPDRIVMDESYCHPDRGHA